MHRPSPKRRRPNFRVPAATHHTSILYEYRVTLGHYTSISYSHDISSGGRVPLHLVCILDVVLLVLPNLIKCCFELENQSLERLTARTTGSIKLR